MSYVKSKDQLANFFIKAIGSKALKNIFGEFGLGDPKTKLESECRKVGIFYFIFFSIILI